MRCLSIIFLLLPSILLAQPGVGFNAPAVVAEPCQTWSGTRAQLLALRGSASLTNGCTYCITDYNPGGCLGAATICMVALDIDRLPHAASVFTTFSNDGWIGEYDIDNARLEALSDDRGNVIRDDDGSSIRDFPWGSANIYGNHVEESTLRVDCDETITVADNRITAGTTLDIRGVVAGYVLRNSLSGGSTITAVNAALFRLREHEASGNSYLGGQAGSSIDVDYGSSLSGFIRVFGNGYLDANNASLDSRALIYVYANSRLNLRELNASGDSRIYERGNGQISTIDNSSVRSRSTIYNLQSGVLLDQFDCGARDYVYNRQSNHTERFHGGQWGYSYFLRNAQGYYVRGAALDSYGRQYHLDGSASGRLYDFGCSSYGYIYLRGGHAGTAQRIQLDTYARLFPRKLAGFQITNCYGKGSWTKNIEAQQGANTIAKGKDYFNDSY